MCVYIYIYIHIHVYTFLVRVRAAGETTHVLRQDRDTLKLFPLPSGGYYDREMGGAPRNLAPKNHFLVWIVKTSGCHCT